MTLEKNQDSLKEELLQAKQNASTAEEEVKTERDMNKILHEYNKGLQKESCNLGKERYLFMKQEFTSVNDSRDDAVSDYESLSLNSVVLEKCCAQTEQISVLEHQLAAANEKLKIVDLSSLEIRRKYEDQKRIVSKLEDRLLEAGQLSEGERLRNKLHNIILELKGDIS
ncbi:unnamed protein product [Lactuca virosa]|uniref:Uncharacterized protein n=1 Tax=Lactuca virosa TaxID=75947 RepID=A0AAU9PE11_9ASTR|nr:unnamed protein product [Lactuca virosa]